MEAVAATVNTTVYEAVAAAPAASCRGGSPARAIDSATDPDSHSGSVGSAVISLSPRPIYYTYKNLRADYKTALSEDRIADTGQKAIIFG